MKLALAQFRPVPGDLPANRERHLAFVSDAVAAGADAIVFPELSLSGYEPRLAPACALRAADAFLDPFQEWADRTGIVIGAGMPVTGEKGLHIGLVFFQPGKPRQTYTKKYLHPDEEPFFEPGTAEAAIQIGQEWLIPAICYEISVSQHAIDALADKRGIYLASVAKTEKGMDAAWERLPQITTEFGVPAAIVNCLGPNDDFTGAGCTAAWAANGRLLGQLDGETEELLIADLKTGA